MQDPTPVLYDILPSVPGCTNNARPSVFTKHLKKKHHTYIIIVYRHSTTLAGNKNASQILLRVVFENKIEIIRRMCRRGHESRYLYYTPVQYNVFNSTI